MDSLATAVTSNYSGVSQEEEQSDTPMVQSMEDVRMVVELGSENHPNNPSESSFHNNQQEENSLETQQHLEHSIAEQDGHGSHQQQEQLQQHQQPQQQQEAEEYETVTSRRSRRTPKAASQFLAGDPRHFGSPEKYVARGARGGRIGRPPKQPNHGITHADLYGHSRKAGAGGLVGDGTSAAASAALGVNEEEDDADGAVDLNAFDGSEDVRKPELPIARVKTVVKDGDPDIDTVSQEALVALAFAAELFLEEFAQIGAMAATRENRKTLHYKDLVAVVHAGPKYEFLEDILPPTIPLRKALEDRARLSKDSNE